jgi:quercetin dioxygenase-like cupin family protein
MKRILFISILFAFAFSALLIAADAPTTAPNNYKTVFENERVRVFDVTVKPGDKIPSHSHPDHLAYPLNSCTLALTAEGGKAQAAEAKPGHVLWSNAVTHSVENTGKTECKLIIVELKESAPKK